MKKLALVLIATVFSAGAFAQAAAMSAPEAGANAISTHSTVAKKHHKHGKKKVVRPA